MESDGTTGQDAAAAATSFDSGRVFSRMTKDYTYHHVVATVVIGVIGVATARYWSSIRKRLHQLQESTFFGNKPKDPFRMIRCGCRSGSVSNASASEPKASTAADSVSNKIHMLALNPDFVQQYGNECKMMSLGDYMSSLRPYGTQNTKLPDWFENEMQAALAAALLKGLGPRFGAAVLPGLGAGFIQNAVHKIAAAVSSKLTAASGSPSDDDDKGGVPLSLIAMTYAAEFNYQRLKRANKDRGKQPNATSPLELLRLGEVGYKPTFNDTSEKDGEASQDRLQLKKKIVPNPFIVSQHWDLAIESMERLVMADEDRQWKSTANDEKEGLPNDRRHHLSFDPHSKALQPPTPIDERWLPDLHLGWGSAQCTHTRRQILQNRLLAVLLNRLASNYYYFLGDRSDGDCDPFVLQMDESSTTAISKPSDFLMALIDAGHSVETCVRTHGTTFGIALCVKEHDNEGDGNVTWTSVPLAYFLQNGYADADGSEAFVRLPHSGLDLEIRGPLLDRCSVQHFMAIEGLCGWHSNHNTDVPWIQSVDCGDVGRGTDAIESVRVAGLEAVIINAVGTKFNLPFGGYGLTGVCNDSAGLIEHAVCGGTHIYPLTFNGKFAMQTLRVARDLRIRISGDQAMEQDLQSLDRLIQAIMVLPSDTNSLPFEAADQIRRQLHCQPELPPFALMVQSRKVIESIQRELTAEEK